MFLERRAVLWKQVWKAVTRAKLDYLDSVATLHTVAWSVLQPLIVHQAQFCRNSMGKLSIYRKNRVICSVIGRKINNVY